MNDFKFDVLLNDIEAVKKMNIAATKRPFDIDVESGRYVVDAKSIMGLFSLDISKPVTVQLHTHEVKELDDFMEEVQEFVVK